MTKLMDYMQDGADFQSRAVLAFLQSNVYEMFDNVGQLDCLSVARWENCREQGYVVSVRSSIIRKSVQSEDLHIAFFEHRNTDSVAVLVWKQDLINPPNIDTAVFQYDGKTVYKDKYDVTKTFKYRDCAACADFILQVIQEYSKLPKSE